MDATQLTFLLGSRTQANSRLTLQIGGDPTGTDNAFSSMLQQREAEQVEQQRQLDQERQTWRNQPSSTPPATTSPAATSPSTAGSTTPPAAESSKNPPAERASQPSRHRDNSAKTASATGSTSSQQSSAASDKAGAKAASTQSTGKTGKTDGTASKDADQAGKDQAASASGNLTNHAKQDLHHPGKPAAGNDASGNGGQNQGQNSQDNASQQGAGDGDAATATAEGMEGAVLATLVTGQAQPKSGATAATMGAGGPVGAILPGHGKPPVIAGANGQPASTGAAASTGATGAAPAGTANLAATLSVPGPGTTPATPSSAGQAGSGDAGVTTGLAPLPQQSRAAPSTDLDTTFANIIAKKAPPASSDSNKLNISISKATPDNSAQMPRPLVRIDDSRTPQASIQQAATLTQTETQSIASNDADFDAGVDQEMGLDDLRGLGTYAPLMTGGGLALAGKQVDAMTALRQQLANASIQDQVAIHMQRAASNSVDKISIQLSPAELGRIHVKMSVDDDKQVSATITVEKPATLDLLQRDTKTLERALQEAGLKTDSGSLSFSLQRGNQGDSADTPGWGQNGGRQVGSSGQEKTAAGADISSKTATNAVDTANGLVDVAV